MGGMSGGDGGAFRLGPGDAERYWVLRKRMLEESPWAFSSDVETDRAREPGAFARRLAEGLTRGGFGVMACADEGGALTAAAGLMRRPKPKIEHRAEIWGVFVRPDVRGQGLGRTVVRAAVREVLTWPGVDSVGLSVSMRSQQALRLYKSLGFRVWGREPDCLRLGGVSYDELHLVLERAEPIVRWDEGAGG